MSTKVLRKIKQELDRSLELPPEVTGSAYVTVSENKRVLIENHRGIINFDDTMISMKTSAGKLSVTGSRLTVKAMADMKIVIEGKIRAVEWD